MYKHILIATDGSELASKGLDHGLALAKAIGAKATVVFVTEPWAAIAPGEVGVAFPIDEYEKSAAQSADMVLGAVKTKAAAAGVTCDVLHMKEHYPAEGILDAVKAKGCDLIVMASHGRRGIEGLLIGSQANRVVTHSTVPVLIFK